MSRRESGTDNQQTWLPALALLLQPLWDFGQWLTLYGKARKVIQKMVVPHQAAVRIKWNVIRASKNFETLYRYIKGACYRNIYYAIAWNVDWHQKAKGFISQKYSLLKYSTYKIGPHSQAPDNEHKHSFLPEEGGLPLSNGRQPTTSNRPYLQTQCKWMAEWNWKPCGERGFSWDWRKWC